MTNNSNGISYNHNINNNNKYINNNINNKYNYNNNIYNKKQQRMIIGLKVTTKIAFYVPRGTSFIVLFCFHLLPYDY